MKTMKHHENCGARVAGARCTCDAMSASLRGAPLAFSIEAGRYFLLGEELHCGDAVDIHLADGTWLAGRFEIERDRDGELHPRFFWHVSLRGDSPGAIWDAWIPIPPYAALRWPIEPRAAAARRLV